MKKLIVLGLFAAVSAAVAFAGDTPAKRRENKDRAEISGTIVSIGETLESAGADAQDSLNSKGSQGLLTGGRDCSGRSWTTRRATASIHDEKLKGKEVKLLGWKFPKTQYIEVSKYQLKVGDKWVAYDYCKNCGWEPGDHKDTDLCEECAAAAEVTP